MKWLEELCIDKWDLHIPCKVNEEDKTIVTKVNLHKIDDSIPQSNDNGDGDDIS